MTPYWNDSTIVPESVLRLTVDQARRVVECGRSCNFRNLIALDELAAREFMRFNRVVELSFPALTQLPPGVASCLSAAPLMLKLTGLNVLTDAVAQALGQARFWLDLGGVKRITVRQARWLAGCSARLSLRGLDSLTPALASALARHQGHGLSLGGVSALSAECAKRLASHRGNLRLAGLRNPSKLLHKIFSLHEGEVLFYEPTRYAYAHNGD